MMQATRSDNSGNHLLRVGFLVGMVCFAAGVVLQIFLAGAALHVSWDYINAHRAFGNGMSLLPIPLLIIAFLARLPRRMIVYTILLIPVIALQYGFLWAVTELGLPSWFRLLHAVNAVVIFVVAERLIRMTWKLMRSTAAE